MPLTICAETEYACTPATLTTDRECCACAVCPGDSFVTLACGGTRNTQCASCRECSSTEYIATACSGTADATCAPCSECRLADGLYTARPCSASSDTRCEPCGTCAAGEWQAAPCTSSAATDYRNVTACREDEWQAAAPTPTSDRNCLALTVCSTANDEYEATAPTATSDRRCLRRDQCDFETEYIKVPGTVSSDRTCASLTVCNTGTEYQAVAPTATADRECAPLTICDEGQGETSAPTATSDRACVDCAAGSTDLGETSLICTACPAGTFVPARSSGACASYVCAPGSADTDAMSSTPCAACDGLAGYQDTAGATSCKSVLSCAKGQEEAVAPTPSSNRVCVSCVLGETYKSDSGQRTECANVTLCAAGEEEAAAPTLSADRVCTACLPGYFKAEAGQASACQKATVCAPGQTENAAPTPTSDRTCKSCPVETFKPLSGSGPCTAASQCAANIEYAITALTPTADRSCATLTVCGAEEWEEVAPTGSSDRVCSACTVCPNGSTQEPACSARADTVCVGCTACVVGLEYIAAPCTFDSDRDCQACATCDYPATEYETAPCHLEGDRTCAQLSQCVQGTQFASVSPTPTSNRVCSTLTVCVEGSTYETTAPTTTTDRQCSNVASCQAGQQEAAAPTLTSNRVCEACPAGSTDADSSGQTKCILCGAGNYVPKGSQGDCSLYRCPAGSADVDSDPGTACVACDGTTAYSAQAGSTACIPVSDCPLGEEELSAPSSVADRTCRGCPGGTFKATTGQDNCTAVQTCDATTEYISVAATPTSDRVCTLLSPACKLAEGEYQSAAPTTTSDRVCTMLTVCDTQTEFESKAPSASSDRVCTTVRAPCDTATQYESAQPTATSDRICTTLTTCPSTGFYVAVAATPISDRVCQAWTTCETTIEYECGEPSAVEDRKCCTLTVCGQSEFASVMATATSDRVCASCDICPEGSHYTLQPCTATSNTLCAGCGSCSAGQFESKACSEEAPLQCTTCTTCERGVTYAATACGVKTDTVCAACSTCSLPDTYVAATCTPTSDTLCNAVTSCAAEEYEAEPPTSVSDRVCTPFTVCSETQYICVEGGAFQDRECCAARQCDAETQFEVSPPSGTSDRRCQTYRHCTTSEYQSGAPTPTSDRQCSLLTTCSPSEYEVQAPTAISDRVCAALSSPCSAVVEYECTAPTASSDRECCAHALPETPPAARLTARQGLFALGDAPETGERSATMADADETTRRVGASVGLRTDGTLAVVAATLGSKSASVPLAAATPTAVVTAGGQLLSPVQVYADDRRVRALMRLDDVRGYGVPDREVLLRLSPPAALGGASATGGCFTDSAGLCVATLFVPSAWFEGLAAEAAASLTFALGDGSGALADGAAYANVEGAPLSLQAPLTVSPANDVVVRLPQHALSPAEEFQVTVESYAPFSAAAFAIKVECSSLLEVVSLAGAGAAGDWRVAAEARDTHKGGIVAQLVAPEAKPAVTAGGQALATITLRVVAGSLGGAATANVDVTVHDIVDLKGERRPLGTDEGSRPLPARALHVDAFGAQAVAVGRVRLVSPRPAAMVLRPVAADILNTAVLSGNDLDVALRVYVAGSGDASPRRVTAADESTLTCVLGTGVSAGVTVASDCARLTIPASGGSAPSGPESTTATITASLYSDVVTATTAVRVWAPVLPLALSLSDATLNPVQGWLRPDSLCAQAFQRAALYVTATFRHSAESVVEDVDVTAFARVGSSDTSIASLASRVGAANVRYAFEVRGNAVGTATLAHEAVAGTTAAGVVSVTVGGAAVRATRLDVNPVASLTLHADFGQQGVSRGAETNSVAFADRVVRVVGQGAFIHASVVMEDATRMELVLADGLTLQSLDASVTVAGQTAVGHERSVKPEAVNNLQVNWDLTACTGGLALSRTAHVPVDVPAVKSLRIELDASLLAAEGTTASNAPLSLPTFATARVVALMTGDVEQELVPGADLSVTLEDAGDPARVVVDAASSAAVGATVVRVQAGSVGSATLRASYRNGEHEATAVLHVAAVDSLLVRCVVPGHTAESAALSEAATATLHRMAGSSPDVFQSCSLDVRTRFNVGGASGTGPLTPSNLAEATGVALSMPTALHWRRDAALLIVDTGVLANIGDGSLPQATRINVSLAGLPDATLDVTLPAASATISNLVLTLPATLSGPVGTQLDVKGTAHLSDGSSLPLAELPLGMAVIDIATSLSPALEVVPSSAEIRPDGVMPLPQLRLAGNSAATGSISVTASVAPASGGAAASAAIVAAVNLLPEKGDADLGQEGGVALRPTAGATAVVEVRVNITAFAPLDELVLRVSFDASIFTSVGAAGVPELGTAPSLVLDTATSGEATLTLRADADVQPAGTTGLLRVAVLTFAVAEDATDLEGAVTADLLKLTTQTGMDLLQGRALPAAVQAGSPLPFVVLPGAANGRRRRRRRSSDACPSPPCATCPAEAPRQLGDTNADCTFDVSDVSYALAAQLNQLFTPDYYTASLLSAQRTALDADGNGLITVGDSAFLDAVLSKRLRFITGVAVREVSHPDSGCRLELEARALAQGDIPADGATTFVYFDLALPEGASAEDLAALAATELDVGSVVVTDKGDGHRGHVFRAVAQADGTGRFLVRAKTALVVDALLLTVIQASASPAAATTTTTTAASLVGLSTTMPTATTAVPSATGTGGDGSSSRVYLMAGLPYAPFTLPTLNMTLPLGDDTVTTLVRTEGYNARLSFDQTQATAACHASTACTASEYEVTASTPTSSVVCAAYTVCGSAQYEAVAPTATSDRTCVDCATCGAVGEQYEESTCTASGDRVCRNVTMCVGAEVELVAPTAFSDRVCEVPNFCNSNPCENGGTCSSDDTGFTCTCPNSYAGPTCTDRLACRLGVNGDIGLGPCSSNTARRCIERNDPEAAFCFCKSGFFGDCCDAASSDGLELRGYCKTVTEMEAESSGAGASGAEDAGSSLIAGGVLGGVLAVVLAAMLIGGLRRRRQRKAMSLFGGGTPLTAMQNPLFRRDPLEPLRAPYRRCVAFGNLRYSRDLPALKDEDLGCVHDLLRIPRPPMKLRAELREDTRRFLASTLDAALLRRLDGADEEGEMSDAASPLLKNPLDEAVDFLVRAFADVMVEEAIDLYVQQRRRARGEELYVSPYPSLARDFYGMRAQQWAIYVDPDTGLTEDPDYEDISELLAATFVKKNGEYLDVYDNAETHTLYETATGHRSSGARSQTAAYDTSRAGREDADYATAGRGQEPDYALGTLPAGQQEPDGGPLTSAPEDEAHYDYGAREEIVYDVGSGATGTAPGGDEDIVYDLGHGATTGPTAAKSPLHRQNSEDYSLASDVVHYARAVYGGGDAEDEAPDYEEPDYALAALANSANPSVRRSGRAPMAANGLPRQGSADDAFTAEDGEDYDNMQEMLTAPARLRNGGPAAGVPQRRQRLFSQANAPEALMAVAAAAARPTRGEAEAEAGDDDDYDNAPPLTELGQSMPERRGSTEATSGHGNGVLPQPVPRPRIKTLDRQRRESNSDI